MRLSDYLKGMLDPISQDEVTSYSDSNISNFGHFSKILEDAY